MKSYKVILISCFVLVSMCLQAQTYRIEAGYLQPIRYSDNMSHRYFQGARLGGTVDFNLPVKFMTVHTGLLYSYTFSNDVQKALATDSVIYKTQGHYLDIPLHLTASYNLFKEVKIFAFAGPNLNIGIYQPQKATATAGYSEYMGVESGTRNLHKDDLNRFNFQLEVGGGVQWKKWLVKSGYNFGMNNLNKKDTGKQHQSGWYVTAGYEF